MDAIIVRNWEEAALALALMQSVVFNFKLRIVKLLGQEGDAMLQEIARATPDVNMTILREAGLTLTARRSARGDGHNAQAENEPGAGAGPGGQERPTAHSAAQALVAEDVSALAVAGVSGASLMVPLPMPVMVDADAVSNHCSLGSLVGASASTSSDVQPLVRGHVQRVVPALAPLVGSSPVCCTHRRSRGFIGACGSAPAVMVRHNQSS